MRRIASGVALHDTRMLVDPLRTQTRAVLMGVLMLITALVGCFVFSLIRPEWVGGQQPGAGRPVHRRVVRAGRRSAAPGAESDVGPADRRTAGEPHHREKQ